MKNVFYLFIVIFIMSCNQNTTIEQKKTDLLESPKVESMPSTNAQEAKPNIKTIVFFGNSLTAAYGLNPEQGFVNLIGKKIDSLGMSYKVVNAGLSGETTAGGNSRIDWILRQQIDVFVLELGANDGLRGISPEESVKNLQSIMTKVKTKYPEVKILLAAMEAPPNMGERFTTQFRAMYPKLAKDNQATLIPFFLISVAGVPSLNQPDGIHPTAGGNKIAAENIWAVLKGVL